MRDNVKFDVALEIVSSNIAKAMKEKNKELTDELLEKREKIYLGDWDTINQVLNEN